MAADSRATQGTPALTGSLPSGRYLAFVVRSVKIGQTGSFDRSNRSAAALAPL
jgi:hypothetical protein